LFAHAADKVLDACKAVELHGAWNDTLVPQSAIPDAPPIDIETSDQSDLDSDSDSLGSDSNPSDGSMELQDGSS
jgi:hypothetical protein